MYNIDGTTIGPPSLLPIDTTSDETVYNNIDDCINAAQSNSNELCSIASLIHSQQPQRKRRKTEDIKPVVFVRFNTRSHGKAKPTTLKALIDTGGSGSLVTTEYATKLKKLKDHTEQTVWTTPAGELKTSE